MLRRLTVLTLALGLLTGACGDDDADGDDNAAVTSLPDNDTTTTTSTTEPRTVAPDVIPTDESQITEDYVEGVLAELSLASLEALVATRDAGVVDERAIAITNATSTEAEAIRSVNGMAEVARNGFDPYHADPGPIGFDVEELRIATPSCIVAAVSLDLAPLLRDPPPAPPGQVFVELVPATEEQRATGLNPTAWVLASTPVIEPGDATPDCEVET